MKPLTIRHAVPVIFQYRQLDAAGGLLSYGSSETEYCRLIGTYTGRIPAGARPHRPALAAGPRLRGNPMNDESSLRISGLPINK
jgi:hypothetical protein